MTDLVDAPMHADWEQSLETANWEPPSAGSVEEREVVIDIAPLAASASRSPLVIAAAAGAGVLHLAVAGSHARVSLLEGRLIALAGWALICVALAVAWRPNKAVYAAAIVVATTVIGAWAVSVTAGLPFGPNEGHSASVETVDVVALILGLAVIAGSFWALSGKGLGVLRDSGLIASGLTLAMVSGALLTPAARDHANWSHGVRPANQTASAETDAARMHSLLGPTSADKGFSWLSNGHQHGVGEEPVDPQTQATLDSQLAYTRLIAEKVPTLGDAVDLGYTRGGPFSPGLGTHYVGDAIPDLPTPPGGADGEWLKSPVLVFDGVGREAPIAGFMYYLAGEADPDGFAGPNDHWHHHTQVCIVANPDGSIDSPLGADDDSITEADCKGVGGSMMQTTGNMVHVWSVPGYESPDGIFTELNPAITCEDGTYYKVGFDIAGRRDSICPRKGEPIVVPAGVDLTETNSGATASDGHTH